MHLVPLPGSIRGRVVTATAVAALLLLGCTASELGGGASVEGAEDIHGPADGGPADGGPADGGPADGGPADGGPADGGAETVAADPDLVAFVNSVCAYVATAESRYVAFVEGIVAAEHLDLSNEELADKYTEPLVAFATELVADARELPAPDGYEAYPETVARRYEVAFALDGVVLPDAAPVSDTERADAGSGQRAALFGLADDPDALAAYDQADACGAASRDAAQVAAKAAVRALASALSDPDETDRSGPAVWWDLDVLHPVAESLIDDLPAGSKFVFDRDAAARGRIGYVAPASPRAVAVCVQLPETPGDAAVTAAGDCGDVQVLALLAERAAAQDADQDADQGADQDAPAGDEG